MPISIVAPINGMEVGEEYNVPPPRFFYLRLFK